jgi:CRP/FNR family transcriptional regulator, cyclic AMP receptor protein
MATGGIPGLTGTAWAALAAEGRSRRFHAGEVVFHQGDPCDALFLLREGRVAVRTVSPEGQELTVGLLAAPDVFGEVGLIRADHHHTATVLALSPVAVVCIAASRFTALRLRHPDLTEWLLLTVTARLERTMSLLAEALYLEADRRLARRLLDCRRSLAVTGDEPLPLTQDDLAAMAGVTRPTANRVLRRLEDAGIVRLGRGHIAVLDPAALEARS